MRQGAEGAPAVRRAEVLITEVDVDNWRARGTDRKGRRYFADARSAISITALREGERWQVLVAPSGLIKGLFMAGT